MRRKRLQHVADTLCHIFCGWETFFDYNELVDLGNGDLRIDALTGECAFNESAIKPLGIAQALRTWLLRDCSNNKIDLGQVEEAQLKVSLDFSVISSRARKYSKGEQFLDDGRQIKTAKMHRCHFDCSSSVKTDEKVYQSKFNKIREWPLGWPKDS